MIDLEGIKTIYEYALTKEEKISNELKVLSFDNDFVEVLNTNNKSKSIKLNELNCMFTKIYFKNLKKRQYKVRYYSTIKIDNEEKWFGYMLDYLLKEGFNEIYEFQIKKINNNIDDLKKQIKKQESIKDIELNKIIESKKDFIETIIKNKLI